MGNMLGAKTKADYLVTGQWSEEGHKIHVHP